MLQQRARDCLARLKSAEGAKGGVEEAEALDRLHKGLTDVSRGAHDACTKVGVLVRARIPVALVANIAKHQQIIASVAERFREKPTAATLKHGKRWPTLTAAVEDAARSIDASLKAAWNTYVGSNLFAGPLPEEEERSLARTPRNRQLMDTYRRLFNQFSELRSSIPTTPEAITHLRKLSAELAAIQFERDVPAAVRNFLDAASTTTGAGLNLLTDEVRQWLLANDLLGSYVIRARIN